ncbi:MAG TPA: hypothetical protein VJ550_13110 [Geomonas sp.]|nr:hypothetical protein [Geomonas sp.]
MVWLKLVGITVILLLGIYLIAFLEEKLVSGPRRRMLERKAREKLAASAIRTTD